MKRTLITTVVLAVGFAAFAQGELVRKVPSFDKISVSPKNELPRSRAARYRITTLKNATDSQIGTLAISKNNYL